MSVFIDINQLPTGRYQKSLSLAAYIETVEPND